MSLSNSQVRATIAVSDIGRATEFYEGRLGLEPLEGEPGQVRIYACGGGTQLQVYESEHAGGNDATAASWSVPEFAAAIEALRSAGIAFETYDELPSENGIHTVGNHRVAWFKDPDGNVIAVDNGQSY